MRCMAKVLDETGIDTQDGVFVVLGLNHIADSQRSDVPAVLEIPRINCLESNFVKDFPALGPLGKNVGRANLGGAADVLVFIVFFGSPDDAILDHILHDLGNFRFGEWHVDDQPHPVLRGVFFAGS